MYLCRGFLIFQETKHKSHESFLRNTYEQVASCLTMCLYSHYHKAFGCCHPTVKSGMKSSLPDVTIISCHHGYTTTLGGKASQVTSFAWDNVLQVAGTISPLAAVQRRALSLRFSCPFPRPPWSYAIHLLGASLHWAHKAIGPPPLFLLVFRWIILLPV